MKKILIIICAAIISIALYMYFVEKKSAGEIIKSAKAETLQIKSAARKAAGANPMSESKDNPANWKNLLPENEKQIYDAAKTHNK